LKGRFITRSYVPTFLYISKKSGKNVLYKIVEAFLNRGVSQEEEETGITSSMLNSFIGKQVRIGVEIVDKGDKKYSNINSFYPAQGIIEGLSQEQKDEILKIVHDIKAQKEQA
jgi:hypothetical protein